MIGLEKRKSDIKGLSRSFRASNTLDREQRMLYADVVRKEFIIQGELHHSVEDVKKLEFSVEKPGMEWLTGSFVGRVHNVDVISFLKQRLRDAGLPQYGVRYMGGDLVLISSMYIDLLHSYVAEGNKQLAKWLAEIIPWKCTEQGFMLTHGFITGCICLKLTLGSRCAVGVVANRV
ncbi:hypothetical protein Ancab_027528 [Ancistrocladus abbreviatus]